MRILRWTVLILFAGVISVPNASSVATSSLVGSVSGRVTSSSNGLGLTGTVQFYDLDDDGVAATANLDGTGNYSVNLPAGSYAVLTQNTQGHINKIWNNVSCSAVCEVNSLTSVDITTNAVTGIDFVLDPGGRVSGTVTSTSTGLPLAGVTVYLIDSGPSVQFTKGVTNIDGIFLSEGGTVAGSVYAVTENQIGYQNEVFDNVKCDGCDPSEPSTLGTLIPVAGSGTTGGVTFALDPGAAISGTVTDGNGVPLANIRINVTSAGFTTNLDTVTDASGHYTTGGMPAGTYFVSTFNNQGFVDKLYNGVLCPSGFCNQPAQGTPIAASVGITPNINFSLSAGGKISGTVTNAVGGAPVPITSGNAGVAIFNSLGSMVVQSYTENDGSYEIPSLPPGTYYAETINVPGFGNQLFSNIGCSGCNVLTGTPFAVTAGNTTPNINFSLSASGSISGTVTNAVGGAALSNLNVQVFSSTGAGLGNVNTNASGVYTLTGLAPGSSYVRTNGAGSFMNEIYDDIFCQQCNVATSGAPLVPVTAGTTTNNINFALATGGRISGTITNASGGAAIQNVAVQLFNAQSVGMGQVNSQANGSYTTAGLPAGTYYVRTNNTLGFINELYNDIPCPITVCLASDGAPITVNAGVTTPNINFALTVGGKITGSVTTAGGAPMQNVGVQVYNSAGRFVGAPASDASGNYTTQALPDGTYFLRSQNGLGFVEEVYDDQPCLSFCNPLSGTAVVVAGGATVAGKNFALSAGGSISGTVKAAGTLLPLSGVGVSVFSSAGVFVKNAATLSNGLYVVSGLQAGTYFMRTTNLVGYRDSIYEDMTFCEITCLPTDGTAIPVTVGNLTAGIDFDLSPGVEMIQNGSFNSSTSNVPTDWSIFAQPNNPNDLVGKIVNGAFEYYRVTGSTAGVILQHTGADFASGAGILAQFSLANTNDVRKRISVLVHEGDFGDIAVCTFWLQPNQPIRRYAVLTHTTKVWTDATISFYAASAGTTGGAYRLDEVTMQAAPGPVEDTTCVDTLKPAITNDPPGPEMLTNGDFQTGNIAPWSTPFDISFQISNGVFEFIRPTGGVGIAGVLQQNTGVAVAAGETVTATFQLGNSSAVTKRVTVLLLDPTFADLSACTFWLPPGRPLSSYTMRSYATQAWGQAAIAFFPATVGNETWIRLDNVSLKKTPSAHIAGTDCNEPTIGPEPPPPDGGAGPMGLAGSSGAAPADSSGSQGSAAVELSTDGSGPSVASLQPIDLRRSPMSALRFESRRGDVSSAEVQVSVDGQTWQSVAVVPASDDWLSVDVDLSQYVGHVVYVRFVMDAEISRDRPSLSGWQIRRVAIY